MKACRLCLSGRIVAALVALVSVVPCTPGQEPPASTAPADQAAELAKKLSNPVAALISVPFQSNFEFGGGPDDDGFRYLLNIQPVIPVSLNEDWNLISRTILPVISQEDMIGDSSQTGLGDTVQSAFCSESACRERIQQGSHRSEAAVRTPPSPLRPEEETVREEVGSAGH